MIRRNARTIGVPLALCAAAALAACQTSQPVAEAEAEPMDSMAMIIVENQAATDSITVGTVSLPADGFVVVHAANEDGTPTVPDSIGHVAAPAGKSENVVVPLEFPVAAGGTVYVMLHEDSGELGVYEFKTGSTDVDLPVTVDGGPVITPITIE